MDPAVLRALQFRLQDLEELWSSAERSIETLSAQLKETTEQRDGWAREIQAIKTAMMQ